MKPLNIADKIHGIPVLETGWFGPLAFLLLIIGGAAVLWLIVWVETSKDLPMKNRLVGAIIRLFVMAFFMGLGIHFYLLSEGIYL